MSPSRPDSSRRNSPGGLKPYTRSTASATGLSTPELKQEANFHSPLVFSGTPGHGSPHLEAFSTPPGLEPRVSPKVAGLSSVERPGFPSYAQYKQVEGTYINSLTPRRQGKALISQALFDRIWDVLHNPESPGETAQFRFWARKMFTISKTYRNTLGGVDPDEPLQEVLLHDNLLVAIQEQLYDLLCFCHGSTGHGGRDKTCALIRKHYTWVPKDLVSNFIKACPTCIMKKCGAVDSAALVSQMSEEATMGRIDYSEVMAASPRVRCSPLIGSGVPWPSLPSPTEAEMPPAMAKSDPLEAAYREAVLRARQLKNGIAVTGLGTPSTRLQGLPGMTREVSLYKGLPNGWQYRHDDYAAAHAEFMKNRDSLNSHEGDMGVRGQRPRVPSVLPFWGPEQFDEPSGQILQEADIGDSIAAHSMNQFTTGGDYQTQASLKPDDTMGYTSFNPPAMAEEDMKAEIRPYIAQIDPRLLQLSMTSAGASNLEHVDSAIPQAMLQSPHKRAALPKLHLDLSPGRGAERSFLSYRDNVAPVDFSPDSPSPHSKWPIVGNISPTSSDRSSSSGDSSQLSRFTSSMMMGATSSISPGNSALPTPVDECSATSVIVARKDSLGRDEERVLDLSAGIVRGKTRDVAIEQANVISLDGI